MQRTNLNIAPIWDDYSEDKNFHRILFGAGKSVQARELTQAQTILQSQIERVGKHLFAEGAMVVPGGIQAIEAQDYIKLTVNSGSTFADFSDEADLYVKNVSNGLIAKVAKVFAANSTDPVTLFIDVITPGTAQQKAFLSGQALSLFAYNTNGTERALALATSTGVGQGSWAKVQNGVYFVRGMFVKTTDQDYVVSKYTKDKTVKIGFLVSEQIVTSTSDTSLLSNASGFPNQNSPGSARLKVTLTLTGLATTDNNKDFIEIARFDGGELASKVDYTNYSLIEQSIARRTYETNGDYVVNVFGLDLKEHLKLTNNGGVYTLANGGDSTKLVASIKPGIGYVKGFRVENIGVQNVVFDKARDTMFLNNAAYSAEYGQYFLVTNMMSLPDIDIKKRLLLLDSGAAQVGTAAVRAVRKDGTNYRIYVFDLVFNTGKAVSNVSSIKYTDASSLFTATLTSSVLYDSGKSSLVFKLPVSAIKSLFVGGVGSDTSYTVLRTFNLTTNSSGVVSASVGTNEFFGPVDDINYFLGLTGAANAGTLFSPVSSVTLGGTIQGTTMTINLGAGQANKSLKVIAPVLKNQTTQKSKTLLTVTDEVISFPDTNRQKLTKADIYDIVSVKDNTTSEDITSAFIFDNGQKDSWYESGKLIYNSPNTITRTVKVTYRYFSHSAGDYFTVDSYSGLAREAIPYYANENLSDYIDFRPLKDAAGSFTSSTVFGEIPKPGDTVRADITYYLPRYDIVCVSQEGKFYVTRGIPSLKPLIPETPTGFMKLYDILIPAYTMMPSDITINSVDNRRYTMRDIGKLEKRIANVEYYTTLSALESSTNKTEVLDPLTGNNRFKNGFAVDGFKDFRMADMYHPDWAASMDLAKGTLNPQFAENAVGYSNSTLVGTIKPAKVFMKSYTHLNFVSQPYATTTINVNPYAVFAWIGKVTLSPDRDFWKDVKYNQGIIINNTINLRGDLVEGSVWSSWEHTTEANMLGGHPGWRAGQYISSETINTFGSTSETSSTDDFVSTSVIPYMRSIPIDFSCSGFRPYTRLYPFWDSVDVSADCKPAGGAYGGAITTDVNGAVSGTYVVPNTSAKKFLVGESVMRFTDSPTDARGVDDLTTQGSTTFLSGGESITRQVTTTNTTVLTASSALSGAVQYIDPIAQTFIVPTPGGAYITKFDIFFSTKSRNIPVTLQLRTAFSGFPTSTVLSSVTLNPASVQVSADGQLATTFLFADPVLLLEGAEYAVVLVSDSQEYNVYIAEQGQPVIGAPMAISKQAHMGVFLTSSNGSTWNPDQTKDMKFNMYRAQFNTSPGTITLDCVAPYALPLGFNSVNTVSGSSTIKIKLKSHGLKVGDTVTVAGGVLGNNISAASINGTKTVTYADIDTFGYVASTNANATGTIGGSVMTAVVNYPFNTLMHIANDFSPEGTSVSWEYQYTSQTTRGKSGWMKMSPNVSIKTDAEGVVRIAGDLQIRATLNNSLDNLSAVIESSGFTTVLVSPRVDMTEKVFNYVTTDIKFNNPNTQATILVGAKLPGSSGMKLYIKKIDTADQDVANTAWVEVIATNPVSNGENFIEYEYKVTGNFVGYKIKIELTGSNVNPPSLSDVRTLAFA